jgi:transposase
MNDQTTCVEQYLPKQDGPFAHQIISVNKADYIELKWEKNYWHAQFDQKSKKVTQLEKELDLANAKIRDLTQRLYGKKSEKKSTKSEVQNKAAPSISRGQQAGSKGHGRTKRPYLPIKEEIRDFDDNDKACPHCHQPYDEFPNTEDSEMVEIEIKAHIRQIKRKRYTTCDCEGKSTIITAPSAPRLLPKTPYGVSIWVDILLQKFHYSQPNHRTLTNYNHLGLAISAGTIASNLQQLLPVFEPIQQAFYEQQMTETIFHNDETGWKVFELIEGKIGYRWYLWVTRSKSVVYYIPAPGRSADIPIEHFSGLKEEKIIVVCDRYSAYKKLARLNTKIILAFCWAHIRRDFLDAARAWPALESWMLDWVEAIGTTYHLNKERLKYYNDEKPLSQQSRAFKEQHQRLLWQLDTMKNRYTDVLADDTIDGIQRDVLSSLKTHWSGAIVFVENPQVPMDNNLGEQSMRSPVNGRKDYHGSGSVASAMLAAILFSIFQTLALWKINPRHWLHVFLTACAENKGTCPDDLTNFLPWEMDIQQKNRLSSPLIIENIDSS